MDIYCLRCRSKTPTSDGHPITTAKGRHALAGTCDVCGCRKQCFTARQTGAGWNPYFPDRPTQFNRDVQQLVPRYTGAQDNASFYAWLQEQPEWAQLKRGDISIAAVQNKARQATAQSFEDDKHRKTPDEIGRERYGSKWDTYSAETKRGLAITPIETKLKAEVSKKNPFLAHLITADPIIINGLNAIYTFLIEGGVEVAKALLKGDPKSALTAIAKKAAPAFIGALTASREDPTPIALKLREIAEQVAGHEGKGIVAETYRFFTGRYVGSKELKQFLTQHGNARILTMSVVRAPIQETYSKLLNIASLGGWQKALSNKPFDTVFHLSLYMLLSDGTAFTLEKVQKVKVSLGQPKDPNARDMAVPMGGYAATLTDVIAKGLAAAGEKQFFVYDAGTANCQEFISSLLKANGLLTPQLSAFINQDVSDAVAKLPSFHSAITDVAGIVGGGIRLVGGRREFRHARRF